MAVLLGAVGDALSISSRSARPPFEVDRGGERKCDCGNSVRHHRAGSGIGRESAQLFAREGAWVVVADIDRAAAETTVEGIRRGAARA